MSKIGAEIIKSLNEAIENKGEEKTMKTVYFLFRNVDDGISVSCLRTYEEGDDDFIDQECEDWAYQTMYEEEVNSHAWNTRTNSWSSDRRAEKYYEGCEWCWVWEEDFEFIGKDWLEEND